MPEIRKENRNEADNIVTVVSKFADDHLNIVRVWTETSDIKFKSDIVTLHPG